MHIRINKVNYDFNQFESPDYESYLDFLAELDNLDLPKTGYITIITQYVYWVTADSNVEINWRKRLYKIIMAHNGYSTAIINSIIHNTYKNTRPMKNLSSAENSTGVVMTDLKDRININQSKKGSVTFYKKNIWDGQIRVKYDKTN